MYITIHTALNADTYTITARTREHTMKISIEMYEGTTNHWRHLGNGAIDADCNITMDQPIPKWLPRDVFPSLTMDIRAKQDQHQGCVSAHGKLFRWTV